MDRSQQGGDEGRRIYLTLLFTDLSDSTDLGGRMEAEHYSEMLKAFRETGQAVIRQYGGQIARIQGDGLLAIFGLESGENSTISAANAALKLNEQIPGLTPKARLPDGLQLALHSGIHSGMVLIADGDLERGRFEVVGDVPNIAAKLCAAAGRGEVLISEESLGPHLDTFTRSESRLLAIKGREQPLLVAALGRKDVDTSGLKLEKSRHTLLLAGRDAEMASLNESFCKFKTSTGVMCVSVRGGPGLGKTRLIEAFLSGITQRKYLTLKGGCENDMLTEPLQPFLQVLKSLLEIEPGLSEAESRRRALTKLNQYSALSASARESLAWMASPTNLESSATPHHTQELHTALLAVFESVTADGPLILAFEDWQWADTASQQLLDRLRKLPCPIYMLVSSRDFNEDDLGLNSDHSISLSPLDVEYLKPLISHFLPEVDPLVANEICQLAGGVPLYVEEICHAAKANGRNLPLEYRIGQGTAWLSSLIASRVERSSPEIAEIVKAASVLGNVFPAWLLERIVPNSTRPETLRVLADNDLIYQDSRAGTLKFKHGITRDVIYGTVGLYERRALHLAVADALEAQGEASGNEEFCEALAYHYAAGSLNTLAARFAERAGDKAMRVSALDLARKQYLSALTAIDVSRTHSDSPIRQWISISHKLGMACVFDPLALADGVSIFTKAAALARDSGSVGAEAKSEYWLGYLYYAKGMAREAKVHCRIALDLAQRTADSRLSAQVNATMGQVLLSACEYQPALELFDLALGSKRGRAAQSKNLAVGSAYTLACKGYLLGDRGKFSDAHDCFEEALALLGDSTHQVASSVRHWYGVVLQWQGQWAKSAIVADQSVRIAEQVRSRQQLAMGKAIAGYSNWKLSNNQQHMNAVRDATSWIEARHGGLATSLNYGWLTECAAALGQVALARHKGALLLQRVRRSDRIGEAVGMRALARLYLQMNDQNRARHFLIRAQASAQARGSEHEDGVNELFLAELEHHAGNQALSEKSLDAACDIFSRTGMDWYLGQAKGMRLLVENAV